LATNNNANYKPTQYYVQAGNSNGELQDLASLGTSGQVLKSNGAAALPSWQDATSFVVTKFTGSGTWTKASTTKVVEVLIWGGGGGGGSGRKGTTAAASGGGGGSSGGSVHMIVPVDFFDTSETVTIGALAAGGPAQTTNASNGNPGTTGNFSLVGNIRALGGGNGGGGDTTAGTAGSSRSKYTFHTASATQGAGAVGDNVTGSNATNQTSGFSPSGGGGGSGADTGTARQAGTGGAILEYTSTTTLIAAAAGGIRSGTIAGADGLPQVLTSTSRGWIAGGGGGGGGGGGTTAVTGGNGGDGGIPGGGGGGSGGGITTSSDSGIGGDGARGEVWIIEYA
jgi:hypothetical protein